MVKPKDGTATCLGSSGVFTSSPGDFDVGLEDQRELPRPDILLIFVCS